MIDASPTKTLAMHPSIQTLQAQALEEEFVKLARAIAQENAARSPTLVDPKRQAAPHRLVMRSGVAQDNDMEAGQFDCAATAELCGRFLMCLDRVYQPEYSHFDVVPLHWAG